MFDLVFYLKAQDLHEATLKLVLSAILGGIIGIERERHGKDAGLRTHMLVAVGSCLITVASVYIGEIYRIVDPTRIASNIVTGIGFLGAGAIIRLGLTAKGLTTAACVWAASGIGLSVGLGFIPGALVATMIIFCIVHWLGALDKILPIGWHSKRIIVATADLPTMKKAAEDFVKRFKIEVQGISVSTPVGEHGKELSKFSLTIVIPDKVHPMSLVDEISKIPGVKHIEVE